MKNTSAKRQREILVNLFNSGKAITKRQARTRYGIKSLSARVFEVRNIHNLPVQTNYRVFRGETVVVYSL